AGADVNAKDVRGMTPLMLAAATDHASPEIVQLLLAKGADPNIKSAAGETAVDWARKFGPTAISKTLNAKFEAPARAVPAAAIASDPKSAAEKSLALIETTGNQFFLNGGCSSCHAQNVVDLAAAVARAKGLAIDEKQTVDRQKLNRAFFGSMIPNLLE